MNATINIHRRKSTFDTSNIKNFLATIDARAFYIKNTNK